jgi:hypothetical protein
MAITINGTGSITGLTAGGLPDGSITTDDLAANAVTAAKLAAGAGGKILQVVQAVKTDTFSTASTSFVDITSYSSSITPTSASNKILVIADVSFGGADVYMFFKLLRNSTDIYVGDASGGDPQAFYSAYGQPAANGYVANSSVRTSAVYLDSPATTSSITYKVQMKTNGSTVYVNRGNNTGSNFARTASSITLLEVAA